MPLIWIPDREPLACLACRQALPLLHVQPL
jgi:hypothetical protein